MNRWFRVYDDAINDPKILRLPEATRWHWMAVLCIASKNDGALPCISDVAIQLRKSEQGAAAIVASLVAAGLLDKSETGFAPHNWNGRQFKSDVSTDRVKRFRQQQRNVSSDVSETPPETDTQTEADTQTEKPSLRSERRRAERLPADAVPSDRNRADAMKIGLSESDIDPQWRQMRDWSASAKNGACLNWDARWRNWCERFVEGKTRAPPRKFAQSFTEIADELEQRNDHEPAHRSSFDLGGGPLIDAEPIGRSRN